MLTTKGLLSAFDGRVTQAYLSYCFRLCLPAAPVLPIAKNERFGTLSFYEQLSDKLDQATCLCVQRTMFESCVPAIGNDNREHDTHP